MPLLAFELGTEEMPAGAIAGAIDQLRTDLDAGLREARLGASSVAACGTPRRLIALAADVPDRQPDQVREVRGPAWSAAFKDGAPTGAAIGFARKQGVAVESLERTSTPQGEYVLARVTDSGKPAPEALGPVLLDAIRALTFPKMMRWGDGSPRFVRPVRWILALLDSEVVPLEFAGVASGRTTRGHRYLAPGETSVATASDLVGTLNSLHVMASPEARRDAIVRQAEALAAAAGGRIPWDQDLLDENVYLVEWPTCLLGAFGSEYLGLPRPVLVTAMKKHQRFFPVEDGSGALMPCFVSVRNGGEGRLDTVRAGNERVLASRFADAAYFHEADKQTPLAAMADDLGRLLFQEKLGTMLQKRQRLERLAVALGEGHGLGPAEVSLAVRAAALCKADLVSRMVVELPALQGVMGREYAEASGEPPEVSAAISEHYLPRAAGDALPTTALGRLLAVADRVDTLVGYVGLGIVPSGSSDPFGLRRAAQGIVQILADQPDVPSLAEMEVQAARGYAEINGLDFELDPLCNSLRTVFDQRLTATLEERGVRYDLIDAALSGGLSYGTVVHCVVRRAQTLQALAGDGDFVSVVQSGARLANILKSADGARGGPPVPGKEGIHGGPMESVERAVAVLETAARSVQQQALAERAEARLYEAASLAVPDVARAAAAYDFGRVYALLAGIRAPVNEFFDTVLVMAEDRSVRRNRLALVAFVDTLYKTLADFTKVVQA